MVAYITVAITITRCSFRRRRFAVSKPMLGDGDWLEPSDGVIDAVIDSFGVMEPVGDTVREIDEVE